MLMRPQSYTVEGMSSLRVAPGSRVSLRSRKSARCTRPGHEMVRKSEISCPGRASASERRSGTQGPHDGTQGPHDGAQGLHDVLGCARDTRDTKRLLMACYTASI